MEEVVIGGNAILRRGKEVYTNWGKGGDNSRLLFLVKIAKKNSGSTVAKEGYQEMNGY